ncbi:uncharacterized protein TRIADDRAFT_57755 [Trichoplax adhaerens]|uniref:Uncharacterized protein n=1 Tax=Trichoplax adhaerens TaxID=10228 RepID=B3S0B6_TRIAD|nr:predicted protein [Trichoplax adhaerens]EDV23983.1 predicted protein [Trichoplax adhaerens]|eukprot:XP_002113509.1 predicted protein [Trichoplax adhaerens]
MTTTNVQIYKYTERDPQNHEESATTVAGNATYSDPNIRLKELGIVFNNNYESGFSSIAIENTNCNNPIHQPTRTIADMTVPQSGQNHRICLVCKFVIGFASVQILIAILGLIINPCPIGSLSISLNLYYVTYWTAGPVLILAIVALIINKKEQQSSRNVKIQSWLVVIIILCLLGQDAILGTFLYRLTRFGISWFCNGILSRSMFIGFNIGVLVIQFSKPNQIKYKYNCQSNPTWGALRQQQVCNLVRIATDSLLKIMDLVLIFFMFELASSSIQAQELVHDLFSRYNDSPEGQDVVLLIVTNLRLVEASVQAAFCADLCCIIDEELPHMYELKLVVNVML